MSVNRPHRLTMIVALAAGALAIACSGGSVSDPPSQVATVVVTAPQTTLAPSQSMQLVATARAADGTVINGRTFTWSSTATDKATVSGSGLLTAIAPGSAVITATAEGKDGTIAITIVAPDPCLARPLPISCGLLGDIEQVSDHPHEVLISREQLLAGDPVVLLLTGLHTHTLSLTGEQVRQIADGKQVVGLSSTDQHHASGILHNHVVRFN